ncbi:ARPP-2 domain-containing protein [Gimesia maris]|uniref:ARPP-2 domain-containing protein n=1 Tax=Gimesia maris TaxID=122 RepID=UPI003A8EF47C
MKHKTTRKQVPLDHISLKGLTLAPSQVLGGVRLVPVLRNEVRADLRLTQRPYDEDIAAVQIDNKTAYYSYIPHAFVADWSSDGAPVAAYGTQIRAEKSQRTTDGKVHDLGFMTARVMQKMRAREDRNRLRFLPLDVSLEGFLSLHFGGPDVIWEEYSRAAIKNGLSPRSERTIPGRLIKGLDDALRVFEIHTNQVGSLVFVGDALASAFIVPHPDDYRAMHSTLLTDDYGELLYYYGLYAEENRLHPHEIDAERVQSLDDLRAEVARVRTDWADLHQLMSHNLLGCPVRPEMVYDMGPFQLQRFMTELDPKAENHIGEAIIRKNGSLEYLKSYRLSAAQCRRAFLLMQLAECNWSLDVCAAHLKCTRNELIFRLENAGFGYLLHQHVLEKARSELRLQ